MAASRSLTTGAAEGPSSRRRRLHPGRAADPDPPRARVGGRVARAIAASGTLFVLTGSGLLAPGPDPRVPEIGSLPGVRPAQGAAPDAPGSVLVPGSPDPPAARFLLPGAPAPAPPPGPPVAVGTEPVELALPARDVHAPVVPVRTGPAGALVVPDPPSTVGWWSPSALPGSAAGTTVIAGHVDSAADGLGALAVLREMVAGEEIVLTGADGREIAYRVTARRQYLKAELPPEVFAVGGPPRLVLITCGGAFDHRTRHYEDNVVVYAEPV